MTRIHEEISILSDHHKAILKSRFPDYDYAYEVYDADWLRLRISKGGSKAGAVPPHHTILMVFFSSSHVKVVVYHDFPNYEMISYADPRFTDDFIGDILERVTR